MYNFSKIANQKCFSFTKQLLKKCNYQACFRVCMLLLECNPDIWKTKSVRNCILFQPLQYLRLSRCHFFLIVLVLSPHSQGSLKLVDFLQPMRSYFMMFLQPQLVFLSCSLSFMAKVLSIILKGAKVLFLIAEPIYSQLL